MSIFTQEEISAYLSYIGLSPTLLDASTPRDFALLKKFHLAQVSHVPYENLSNHYSPAHIIDINPRTVYAKILTGRGRGGQCMEVNLLVAQILKGLGFKAYPTAVRNRPRVHGEAQGDYVGVYVFLFFSYP
jgi:arylamine N-acetyltransferase